MKIKYLFLLLLAFSYTSYANQSKQRLIKQLDNEIHNLQNLIRFDDTEISFTTVIEDFDPKEDTKEPVSDKHSPEKIQKFFDNLLISTKVVYPYSLINLELNYNELAEILGKDRFYYYDSSIKVHPKFKPIELVYLDGSKETINNKYVSLNKIKENKYEMDVDLNSLNKLEKYLFEFNTTYEESLGFYQHKPIKKIKMKIEIPMEKYQYFPVEKNQEQIKILGNSIEKITWNNQQIEYIIPDSIADKLSVIAYYKDGRILEKKSQNSKTFIDEQNKALLEILKNKLQETKQLVIKNKLKSEDEISSHIEKIASDEIKALENLDQLKIKINYSGPIDKIVFKLHNDEFENYTFYTSHTIEYEQDYIVAIDTTKDYKQGILSKKGEWLVEAQFDEKLYIDAQYYLHNVSYDEKKNEYIKQNYHFSPDTKEFKKVNYLLTNSELYQNKFVIIQSDSNSPKGLADATTGEIVLPMEYNYLELVDNKVWIVDKNYKKGLYDLNLKPILPIEFKNIVYIDDLLEVRKEDGKDIYNLEGKQLTNLNYNDRIGSSKDIILLEKYEENYQKSHYFLINRQGEILLNIDPEKFGISSNISNFSEGLIAVKDNLTNKWGYINTKGKWVIPPQFTYIYTNFLEETKYALVEKDEKYHFIDTKGQIIKTLPYQFNSFSSKPDKYGCTFYDWDGNCYDSYGEPKLKNKE